MEDWEYYFLESAGGTYNCRMIAGTQVYSLHSYGLALDLNPSKNPHKSAADHGHARRVRHRHRIHQDERRAPRTGVHLGGTVEETRRHALSDQRIPPSVSRTEWKVKT